MKLSIVTPAYNEEKRIGAMLEEYSKVFENLRKSKKLDYEILVVINNTKDRTEEIVKKAKKKNKHIKYLNLKQGGKGYAIIEGFKDSLKKDFDTIGFVDSDMATPPEEFARLAGRSINFDGIIASRYTEGAKLTPKPTLKRLLAGRIYNIFIRTLFLFPYRDTQCGAKIFKRDALSKIMPSLSMSKWAFDIDLLYNLRKYGFNIREEPTIWSDKEYSKINFIKAGPWMAMALIRLRVMNSPFKPFLRPFRKVIDILWRMSQREK